MRHLQNKLLYNILTADTAETASKRNIIDTNSETEEDISIELTLTKGQLYTFLQYSLCIDLPCHSFRRSFYITTQASREDRVVCNFITSQAGGCHLCSSCMYTSRTQLIEGGLHLPNNKLVYFTVYSGTGRTLTKGKSAESKETFLQTNDCVYEEGYTFFYKNIRFEVFLQVDGKGSEGKGLAYKITISSLQEENDREVTVPSLINMLFSVVNIQDISYK